MVMLNTSLGYLNGLIKKKLSLDELEDLLFNMGFELDDVKGDDIAIEMTAERPDLLCVHGLARAINHYLGEKPKEYKTKKSGYQVIIDKSVSMRPYTACAIVRNIHFEDEMIKQLMQMQEKLASTYGRNRTKSAYGLYPLKGINFPIHYIAKDPKKIKFKPLGFDEEVTAIEIEQTHPKGKEYNWIAKNWKKYPFFIDDKDNVMCMLPYTNSEDTGKIDETTTEIFIECTGVDFENVMNVLNIFVTMFADMGGDIYSLEMVYPDKRIDSPDLNPEKINLKKCNAEKRLGLRLSDKELYSLLERTGYIIKGNKIFAPCYRTDLLHEVDVIDDIARAYGPGNFIPEFPQISTIGNLMRNTRIETKVRELIVGLGFQEVFTLILTSKEEQFGKMRLEGKAIFLDTQVDKSINMIRVSLLPELLRVLKTNQHYEFPQKIFEVGKVLFPDKKSETRSRESTYLALIISNSISTYEEISSVLNSIFLNLNISYKLKETEDKRFIKGRVAKIIVNGKERGIIGEICPKVLDNFKLDNPTTGFELDLDFLN
ncbi:MAG: phenylalanine--tRNA ligase subunit beta [Candidatus Aenigmatarchaeota archaeon]|nr:MAG: phenylalanine--tRNA ligase subunit beta [Candidatus Aenigmarchaeota archaeon]